MKHLQTARLGVEALENRWVPAGNVFAEFVGGQLVVLGDAAANSIRVEQDAAGTITITGQGTTRVNGRAAVSFANANLHQAEFVVQGPFRRTR